MQMQQSQQKMNVQSQTFVVAKKQPVASKAGKQASQRRGSKTSSAGASRRGSKTTKSQAATAAAVEKYLEPTPTIREGRLSLSANTGTSRGGSSRSSGKKAARGAPGPHMAPLVGPRIAELVRSIDPNYGIEADAEEQILQLADDFLDKVTKQAVRLAQHRGSKTLDVRDLQIVLSKNFGIVVPGLGLPAVRPIKGAASATSGPKVSSSAKRNANTALGGASGGPLRKKSSMENPRGGAPTAT